MKDTRRSKGGASALFALAGVLACLMGSVSAQAGVWKATQKWDTSWEERYSAWVKTELKADYFSAATSRFPLILGNAQYPYAARIVFSYLNGLPVSVRSSLNSRAYTTNDSTSFDKFAEGDERFNQFLKYLVENDLSQHSLHRDTFPLAVHRNAIQPGAMFVVYEPARSMNLRFARLITQLDDNGFMTYFWTLETGKLRPAVTRQETIWEQPDNHDGFVGFRWPKAQPAAGLQDHSDDSRMSREQYRNTFWPEKGEAFSHVVQTRLSLNGPLTNLGKTEQEISDLCWHVRMRLDWVNEGLEFLAEKRKTDPTFVMKKGSREYDTYSTPSRDGQIKDHFGELTRYYVDNATIRELLAKKETCTVVYAPDKGLTLGQYLERMQQGKLSSDPNDPLEKRWGEI